MPRRHDLDWVRVCAFGLLVLYHVGMYYVSWGWHVKSPHAGPTLEPLMLLSAPWRLSLLFLVSGVATAHLLGKGAPGFLRQRSVRLLLPLAVGMLVVVPPQAYFEIVEKAGWTIGYGTYYGRYLAGEVCHGGQCIITPTWNHLWFVAYLWVYTAALYGLVRLAPRWLERARRGLTRAVAGVGLLLWPALFLAVARMVLAGRFPSTHALVDDVYNHVQYFPVFMFGFLAARAEGIWTVIERLRWPALALWLGTWLATVAYFGQFGEAAPPPQWLRLAMRAVWGLDQWCAIVAVLGFARRLSPGDGPVLRYLTQAVFPVYILHQTLIIVLSRPLLRLELPAWQEGPLLVAATFALAFGGYELIRRSGPLRPLFGLRATPRRAPQGPAPGGVPDRRQACVRPAPDARG